MTAKILGALMLLIPFLALFFYMVIDDGWEIALKIYGSLSILVLWIIAALWLINGSL